MHISRKHLSLVAFAMAMAAQTAQAGTEPMLIHSTEPQQQNGYYIITSAGHLQWLAEYVNSAAYMDKPTYLKVRLGGDVAKATHSDYIDAIGGQYVTLTNGNKVKSYFYGEFDGQNHSVGFNMRPLDQCTNNGYPNSSYRGLFGSVQNSKIHNVLVNAPVVEGNFYVGGLAGSASSTTFEDITVYCPQINITGNNGGGIVGSATSSSFKYCVTTNGRPQYTSYVRQDNTFSGQGIVGGIVGNLSNSSATYCVNTVDVYIKDWGEIAGGIAGQHFANTSSQTISHCGNTGTISSSSHESASIGSLGDASGYYAGGIVGYTNSASGVSYTFDECFTDAAVNAPRRSGYIVGWAGSRTDGNASSSLTLKNCYYVQQDCYAGYGSSNLIGMPKTQSPNNSITISGVYLVTEEDFEYGRIAYELNQRGGKWAQDLCLGKLDVLGRTPTPEECTSFNSLSKIPYPAKMYARHGLRGHCGNNVTNHDCDYCKLPAYAIEEPTRDSKGVLQISKREHLLWLREMHNALALHSGEDHSKSNIDIPTFDATLTADIALVSETSVGVYHKWTGIGNEFVPYTGTFDGARHTIAGLDADYQAEEHSRIGLFGLTSGATIKNVKIARSTFGGTLFVGAIVGDAENTTITTCYTAPNVTVNGTLNVGGIGGWINGKVNNCTNCAEVKAKGNSSYPVARAIGGIGGYVNGTTSSCLNFGKVGIDNKQVLAAFIGGIAGEARGTLRYCGNAANINENFSSNYGSSESVGGLVGSIGGLNSTGTFGWSENFSSADKVCGPYDNVGLVAGYAVTGGTMYSTFVRTNTRYEGYSVTTKMIADRLSTASVGTSSVKSVEGSTFSDGSLPALLATNGNGWGQILCTDEVPHRSDVFNKAGQYVANTTKAEHGSKNAEGNCPYCNDPLGVEPSQDGEGYYLVSRPHHLIWFREQAAAWTGDVNNRYTFKARLENDIDLSACRVWTSIGNPGDPSSEGALPIEVTFDGQGHTICGLGHKGDDYVRFSDKCGGLFGNLFESNITNLTVDTSWPGAAPIESFYYSTAPYAGILCASVSSASFITGVTTKGVLLSSAQKTGGIAGYSAFAQFTDCTNDASILCNQSDANTDADTPTGGIVGEAYFLCIFDRCVNNGEVMVSQHKNFTGGLIGRVNELAQIDNCANTGNVSNTAKCSDPNCQHGKMGGLIGGVVTVGLTDQVGFTIHNTWSSGLVENKYGTYETGSFIGYVEKNCKPDLDVFSNCVTRMGGEPIGWAPAGFPHDITGVNEDGFARGTAASLLLAPWGHNVIIGTDGLLQADPADRYPQLDGTPVYSATISKVVFQGDANEDGRWTADDANDFSEQLAAGHLDNEPSSALLRMFDTNHDGRFSILDLTTFIRKMMAVGE